MDCWDGDDGTPDILHGRTLTSRIKFVDVVKCIRVCISISVAHQDRNFNNRRLLLLVGKRFYHFTVPLGPFTGEPLQLQPAAHHGRQF